MIKNNIIRELNHQGLLKDLPKWLEDNLMFLGVTGSEAYGVSSDNSDMDLVGFCIPPKDYLFPHLRGEIDGFGIKLPRFENFQQHHVERLDINHDITIYSIVKFFQLTMENNPNMIDNLFLPRDCVLVSTAIYEKVRSERRLFLTKNSWHKFRGYAYAQMAKIHNKTNSSNPKRFNLIQKFGYDTKFAYHIVRLLLEVEQILKEHDLDLTRNKEFLLEIREGSMTLKELMEWFESREKELQKVYDESDLRNSPDERKIKEILVECLEMHYGSISNLIKLDKSSELVTELKNLVRRYE